MLTRRYVRKFHDNRTQLKKEYVNSWSIGVVISKEKVLHFPKTSPLQIHQFDVELYDDDIETCLNIGTHKPENLVHEVLKVTLRSGDTVAIDLSCAQYGLLNPVSKWSTYQDSRIKCTYMAPQEYYLFKPSILQVDDYSSQTIKRLERRWPKDQGLEKNNIMPLFLKKVKIYILRWQLRTGIELHQMWNKSLAEFLDEQQEFIGAISKNMKETWEVYWVVVPWHQTLPALLDFNFEPKWRQKSRMNW